MINFVKKIKGIALFATIAAIAILITGCEEETPIIVEEVDLTQPTDLFEEPLQPNPLLPKAEDVVITVNGKKITHGEIMQGVQLNMMQLSRQIPQQQLSQMADQIYQNVTDTLIANILMTEAAEKSSLTINNADLDVEIAGIESNAPEDSSLRDALAKNDIDFEEWKENLRKQMIVRKLIEEQISDMPPASEVEIAAFYEENADSFKMPETVTASHILLAFIEEDTDETKAQKKAQLEKIKADIETGGNFEELAKEYSDCNSSQRGGNLGSFSRGQMVPEFETVAFSIEPGNLSEIIETQFGYHLIKSTDHKKAGVRSLAEVQKELQVYLDGQKKQEVIQVYVEKLKKNALIVRESPDLDASDEPPTE